MKVRELISLIAVITTLWSEGALAAQKSQPSGGDPRIRSFNYQPNAVFEYTGFLKIASRIDLDPGESISNITMGDQTGWQINPVGSSLFLKPLEPDANTHMTIMTDKRTYYFELYSKEARNMNDSEVSFATFFNYSDDTMAGGDSGFMEVAYEDEVIQSYVPDPIRDAPMLNFGYSMSGSKQVAPLEVFDDGEFTYFKFKDTNADYPAIFQVLPDGNEALINFRVSKEKYVVVEMVTSQYTLRFGNQIVCVFNDKLPIERTGKKNEGTTFFGIF